MSKNQKWTKDCPKCGKLQSYSSKSNLKIATILPYKENYTFSKAQAAAIWVKDFFHYSIHKNNNYIYGNTDTNDFLTKNYINIKINSLKLTGFSPYHSFVIKRLF